MKTTLRVQPPSALPQGAFRTPADPDDDDRATDFAFYFLMGTLVLGLVLAVVLGVWLTL